MQHQITTADHDGLPQEASVISQHQHTVATLRRVVGKITTALEADLNNPKREALWYWAEGDNALTITTKLINMMKSLLPLEKTLHPDAALETPQFVNPFDDNEVEILKRFAARIGDE